VDTKIPQNVILRVACACRWVMDDSVDQIAKELRDDNFCVVDGFLGRERAEAVYQEVKKVSSPLGLSVSAHVPLAFVRASSALDSCRPMNRGGSRRRARWRGGARGRT
jgi:hypothetical protein